MWTGLFNQHLRETRYLADLAGHSYMILPMDNSFGFAFSGYNQGFQDLYTTAFQQLKQFKPDRQYFEDMKERRVRAHKNALFQEPYILSNNYSYDLLQQNYATLQERLAACEQITFEEFLAKQQQWL